MVTVTLRQKNTRLASMAILMTWKQVARPGCAADGRLPPWPVGAVRIVVELLAWPNPGQHLLSGPPLPNLTGIRKAIASRNEPRLLSRRANATAVLDLGGEDPAGRRSRVATVAPALRRRVGHRVARAVAPDLDGGGEDQGLGRVEVARTVGLQAAPARIVRFRRRIDPAAVLAAAGMAAEARC